jgi:hypothetical protein
MDGREIRHSFHIKTVWIFLFQMGRGGGKAKGFYLPAATTTRQLNTLRYAKALLSVEVSKNLPFANH